MNARMPAFPVPPEAAHTGVSIRDWIAVAAMQGYVTKGLKVKADRAMTDEERQMELATHAYQLADAMLRVRAQTQTQAAPKPRPASPTPQHTGSSN